MRMTKMGPNLALAAVRLPRKQSFRPEPLSHLQAAKQHQVRLLGERIPRPPNVFLRPIKERSENRQKGNTPAVDDGTMHRVTRDEHEIAGLDSPGLIAYSEPALAVQD